MKGVSIGQTTVSAVVVDKKGRKVTSAPQQIEVQIYVNYLNVSSYFDSYKYYAIFLFNLFAYFYLFFFILGISTIQTHSKEGDSVNWSNDAGMFKLCLGTADLSLLPEEFVVIFQKSPLPGLFPEDDVCLIALGSSSPFIFPQLML